MFNHDDEEKTSRVVYTEQLECGPMSVEALESLAPNELAAIIENASDRLARLLQQKHLLESEIEFTSGVMRQTKETVKMKAVK